MKNIICIITTLLFTASISLQAQVTDRGNFLAGSSLGFSKSSSELKIQSSNLEEDAEGPSSLQLSFAPKIGYFLGDNFALGLGMDLTFSRLEEQNTDRNEDSDLLFGPFARYYFPLEDGLAFFAEANFGFGNSSDDLYIADVRQSINTNIFATGFGPGFTIISSNGIGLEAIFKYNYARSKFNTNLDGIQQETITRTNQFDFSLGVQYYFSGIRPVIYKP